MNICYVASVILRLGNHVYHLIPLSRLISLLSVPVGFFVTISQNPVRTDKSSGPPLQFPESPSAGDDTLQLALKALESMDYTQSMTLINQACEQDISWDAGKAEAYNLRGTFKYVHPPPPMSIASRY